MKLIQSGWDVKVQLNTFLDAKYYYVWPYIIVWTSYGSQNEAYAKRYEINWIEGQDTQIVLR